MSLPGAPFHPARALWRDLRLLVRRTRAWADRSSGCGRQRGTAAPPSWHAVALRLGRLACPAAKRHTTQRCRRPHWRRRPSESRVRTGSSRSAVPSVTDSRWPVTVRPRQSVLLTGDARHRADGRGAALLRALRCDRLGGDRGWRTPRRTTSQTSQRDPQIATTYASGEGGKSERWDRGGCQCPRCVPAAGASERVDCPQLRRHVLHRRCNRRNAAALGHGSERRGTWAARRH